ncbi:MAG TPA: response regulator transcription factor, partial [Candidatus Acidoferrales bacterium]|nr:response regulator transcription factor [Candidatus Acidoferrales bacterium]
MIAKTPTSDLHGSTAIRVLVVDDQILTRMGLRMMLQPEKDIEIVGEAANGREAIEKVLALSPEVVLMDLRMPESDGIEATLAIRQRCPTTQVLILSVYADLELFRKAAAAGAVGYVLKDITPANLVNAIRAVRNGKTMINPAVAMQMVENLVNRDRASTESAYRGVRELTERDIEVLAGVTQGLADKEIAAKLFLSESTVKTHLRAIYRKL